MATKPHKKLANTSKGRIHHVEVHPAKTASGGLGFTTKVFRHRSPQQEKDMAAKAGMYHPEVNEDHEAETIHDDPSDMADHVLSHFGAKYDAPDEDDDEDDASAGEGAYKRG